MNRERAESHTANVAGKIKSLRKMSELEVEDMITLAEEMGRRLSSREVDLKRSQIRRFLDAVKKIEAQVKRNPEQFSRESLLLLKPKLAYATGRLREGKNNPLGPFQEVIDPAIDRVKDYADFMRFANFMESIIAYHRFHGGKE
ncbi:MAG: type III-A CRISPR-associated protein Csm2 [Actinobacteria bacterium]|nr:type III-A CRISPR-associated protein Csm2 [Actinomycetota bacterium]